MNNLIPNRIRYNKCQKGKTPRGNANKGYIINSGNYGIKCLESGILTSNQLESTRRALSRKTKRIAKISIKKYPNRPVTKKPIEVRMGKGKGSVHHWITKVYKGELIFELTSDDGLLVEEAFSYAKSKLPIKTMLIRNIY